MCIAHGIPFGMVVETLAHHWHVLAWRSIADIQIVRPLKQCVVGHLVDLPLFLGDVLF